jgi:hypothetical protein
MLVAGWTGVNTLWSKSSAASRGRTRCGRRVRRAGAQPGSTCVTNVERSLIGASKDDAVQEMKDCWPFGVALRGEASSRPLLR